MKFCNYKSSVLFILTLLMILSCRNTITDSIPLLLDRGELIQLDKEWESVQNVYMKNKMSLLNDNNNDQARLNIAYIFVQEARVTGEHGHYYPAALELLNDILNHPVQNDLRFRALATKAGVLLSLHDFSGAKKTGLEAISMNAHNAQVYGVLTDAFVELGDYKQAIVYADRMMAIKPDLRSYARISYLREIHGDIKGAMRAFRMAIEAGAPGYEDRAWAMHTLGEILIKYDRLEEAEEIFETILDERSNYPFAVASLGEIALQNGAKKEAESYFNEAINIIPEVGFFISLAHIYKEQNRINELDDIMIDILSMLEDDELHGHNMNLEYASLYLDVLDDTDKSMSYALLEYYKRPNNIDVNKAIAQVFIRKGDIESARPYIEIASATSSKDPEIIALQNLINTGQLSLAY